MRRVLRQLSTILIMAGVLLIADAILAVTWQEPVSAYLAQRSQSRLSHDLQALEQAEPSPVERRALRALPDPSRRIAYLARRERRSTPEGDALGRIVFPTLGQHFVVVAGDEPADLRKGPGHYPETKLPGERSTVAIAGHRTTYLAPFRHVDRLRHGDTIVLEMPYGRFSYVVQGTKIVQPTDLSVIRDHGYDRLVLTACHPLYSAAERIVVFARLAKVVPSRRISDLGAVSSGR